MQRAAGIQIGYRASGHIISGTKHGCDHFMVILLKEKREKREERESESKRTDMLVKKRLRLSFYMEQWRVNGELPTDTELEHRLQSQQYKTDARSGPTDCLVNQTIKFLHISRDHIMGSSRLCADSLAFAFYYSIGSIRGPSVPPAQKRG